MGEHIDTDYHEAYLEPQVMDLLPKLVYHMDEPVADPAIITSYLICRSARERLTVLLSGMGGDEVFAGYPRHAAVKVAEAYNLIPVILIASGCRRLARRPSRPVDRAFPKYEEACEICCAARARALSGLRHLLHRSREARDVFGRSGRGGAGI